MAVVCERQCLCMIVLDIVSNCVQTQCVINAWTNEVCTAVLDICTNCYRVIYVKTVTVCIARQCSSQPVQFQPMIIPLFSVGIQVTVFWGRLHWGGLWSCAQEVSSLTLSCIKVRVFCTLHLIPLYPPFSRTHYRRQKRWWSAYLLFYDRVDQEKVFEGMWAVVAHVHVYIFWYCGHYIPWAVGIQAVYLAC